MKCLARIFAYLAFVMLLTGCESADVSQKYTIASKKGMYNGEWLYNQPYYNVYDHQSKTWHSVEGLSGVEHEYGTEYVVEGKLTTSEDYWNQGIADASSDLKVTAVISKEVKNTELPEGRVTSADNYDEYFGNEYLVASQHVMMASPISGYEFFYLQVCDMRTQKWYYAVSPSYDRKLFSGKEYVVRGKLLNEQEYRDLGFDVDNEPMEPRLCVEYILSEEEKTTILPDDIELSM